MLKMNRLLRKGCFIGETSLLRHKTIKLNIDSLTQLANCPDYFLGFFMRYQSHLRNLKTL